MHTNNWPYKNNVAQNHKIFAKMLSKINQQTDIELQQKLAFKAIIFALGGSSGYYSSETIENVYLKIAQNIKIELPEHKPNTILHIMTECYDTGGHTRVVERWIENSPSEQKHSLLFTENERQQIPLRLKNAVHEKRGEIFKLKDNLSNQEKAIELRKLASNFEYVVLHIHQHDVVPLIAFGTNDFKRPVLFYNHSDHKFFVGISIADVIVDLREWGQKLNIERRGIKKDFILGIPTDINISQKVNTNQIRKELNLPINKKIILTVGSPHKYKPLGPQNFFETANKILDSNPDALMIGIGFTFNNIPGLNLNKNLRHKNFIAIGKQSPEQLTQYLLSADIVIDSFPMSGGTAMIDAVKCGRPVVSLDCPTGQMDYLVKSSGFCTNEKMLIDKVNQLLENDNLKQTLHNEQLEKLKKYSGTAEWHKRLDKLFANTPAEHRLHTFKTNTNFAFTPLDSYLYSENYNRKLKFKIPYILKIYKVTNLGKKYKEFIFLNKFIIKKKSSKH